MSDGEGVLPDRTRSSNFASSSTASGETCESITQLSVLELGIELALFGRLQG